MALHPLRTGHPPPPPYDRATPPPPQSLLDRICEAYYLPAWCSIADYQRLFGGRLRLPCAPRATAAPGCWWMEAVWAHERAPVAIATALGSAPMLRAETVACTPACPASLPGLMSSYVYIIHIRPFHNSAARRGGGAG